MHKEKFDCYLFIYMKKIHHYVIDFAGKFLLRGYPSIHPNILVKFSVKTDYDRRLVIIFYGVLV